MLIDTPSMASNTIVFLTHTRREWLARRYVTVCELSVGHGGALEKREGNRRGGQTEDENGALSEWTYIPFVRSVFTYPFTALKIWLLYTN